PIFSTAFSTWDSVYTWSSTALTPAFLPVSPSLPVPPLTPVEEPPATPLPLKSFSLVSAFDRSIEGSFVGTFTGGAKTLNPFGGARGASFGSWGTTNFGVGFGLGGYF